MIEERFFSLVEYSDNCWLWKGPRQRGYGYFFNGEKTVRAHRWSYEYFKEPLNDLLCCHHCDNPSCVNPFHLFSGTQSDNMQDCVKKGRAHWSDKTHCIHGHALKDNVYIHPNGRYKVCLTCKRKARKEYYDKNYIHKRGPRR